MRRLFGRKIVWQQQTLLAGGLTLLTLLVCAWLPSIFRADVAGGDEPTPPGATASPAADDRRALWVAYRRSNGAPVTTLPANAEGAAEAAALGERLRRDLSLDLQDYRQTSSGENWLETQEGLRLYHCWREWTGDWSNWLELYIDMDTLEVYSFYLSTLCLRSFESYQGMLPDSFDNTDAAALWGDALGLGLPVDTKWSGNAEEAALVQFEGISYRVSSKYYFDPAYPSGLFEILAEIEA